MSGILRVLVVEDNPADADFIHELLPETGPVRFKVESVSRLTDALVRLESKGIDLILLDLGLPDSHGLETYHKLRKVVTDIPVIVLTGGDNDELAANAVRDGAQDYLVKGQIGGSLLVRAARYAIERQKTAAALRTSEENYRGLFENSHDAVMTVAGPAWRFTSGNPAAVQLFGAKNAEDFVSHGPLELSPEAQPDGRASAGKAREMIETAMRAGSHFFEWTHRRISGEEFFADVLLTRMEQQGEVILQATVRDITARKQAEAQRERLAALVEASADFIGFADPKTAQIQYINKHGRRMCGIGEDEDLGKLKISDVHPAWMNRRMAEVVLPAAVRDGIWQGEGAFLHRNGREIPVLMTLQARKTAHGEIDIFYTVSRDITERKKAEESNTRLATAVEQAAETIVITDTNGTILYVNPAFERTSGYTREEAIGKTPRILKSGKQDAKFYCQMWAVLTAGGVWSGHFSNRRKDGTLYEEDANISPVRDAAGQIVNYVAVKRDVTREVELEAAVRQAQKMEAIGQLAGGVAHDFNNLLAIIRGNVDLVLVDADKLNTEARESLHQVIAASERAANLTRQLLAFSRKQVLQSQPVNLNDLIGNLVKMLGRIIGEDIQLQCAYAPGLPAVEADIGMLEQVVLNLVVNARDAMPDGGQLVIATERFEVDAPYARLHPEARVGEFVSLRVSDTGTGIAAEHLLRIFEPFYTTKEVDKGTGLGLANVHGIVKQHQGWIEVDTCLGAGTTFRVLLPAVARPEVVGKCAL